MSRTVVDVHEYTHTCGDHPTPHVYDTRRIIVEHAPSGPCLAPAVLRVAGQRVSLPCGRVRPSIQQCDACRPVLVLRTVTVTHTGPYGRATSPVPSGLADAPCQVCGQPLAAALAGPGVHVLCARGWTR